MNAKYVLTSRCLDRGALSLTYSLRQHLTGLERVRFVDEEGEGYEARVDWTEGVVEGLGPYFAKKRLQPNETLLLSFQGEVVRIEALNRGRPRRAPAAEPLEAPSKEPPKAPPLEEPAKKVVRVTPYPREVLFPQGASPTPPAATEDLARLGFLLTEGGPPWVYQAHLGRRTLLLALLRHGEEADLTPWRRRGALVATLAPESLKEEVPGPVLTPEGLGRLLRLKARFPVSALDLELLLKEGRLDLESVEALEDRLALELAGRGAFASLLLLLARHRLGEVFLLSDLEAEAQEEGLLPETVRQGVETLAQPPFALLKRLSPGEFLLQQEVETALDELSEFAQALRARIRQVRSL
ncbi:hypothetical protein [Thermus filiformis]|uniref:Uncharacterized protein n=1 Tax=Thermus filiformis TaxID=276 RepID=A0A0A2WVZ5_THEFI|nr:hypothetical protein [Thermus filiformis]KGQ22967.1 hypothetical protein THFILI_07650 [Thermus filiformis]